MIREEECTVQLEMDVYGMSVVFSSDMQRKAIAMALPDARRAFDALRVVIECLEHDIREGINA